MAFVHLSQCGFKTKFKSTEEIEINSDHLEFTNQTNLLSRTKTLSNTYQLICLSRTVIDTPFGSGQVSNHLIGTSVL